MIVFCKCRRYIGTAVPACGGSMHRGDCGKKMRRLSQSKSRTHRRSFIYTARRALFELLGDFLLLHLLAALLCCVPWYSHWSHISWCPCAHSCSSSCVFCVQTARQTSSPAQHGRKAAELLYDGHSVPAAQQRQGFSPSLAIAAVIVVPFLSSLFSSALAFFFRQQKQHCYIFFFLSMRFFLLMMMMWPCILCI